VIKFSRVLIIADPPAVGGISWDENDRQTFEDEGERVLGFWKGVPRRERSGRQPAMVEFYTTTEKV
jgi:hypothetical protein